jgi:hypothetical protein
MKKILDNLNSMSCEDRYSIIISFLRLIATLLAPLMVVALQYMLRQLGVM